MKSSCSFISALIFLLLALVITGLLGGCVPPRPDDIVASLTPPPVTATPPPTRAAVVSTDTGGNGIISAADPDIIRTAGLLIEDYSLVPAGDYALTEASWREDEELYLRLPRRLVERANQALETPIPSARAVNDLLAIFDARLARPNVSEQNYIFYRHDQMELSGIQSYSVPQLNTSLSDFVMTVVGEGGRRWVIRSEGIEPLPDGLPAPFFAGDSFVELASTARGVQVMVDGQPVYDLGVAELGPGTCPVEAFRPQGNQWALEMAGQIIIDGVSLTDTPGYNQAFSYQQLDGQPFYIYQQGESEDSQQPFRVSYRGSDLPLAYEEVVRWSCEGLSSAAGYPFGVQGSDQGVRFFARDDGFWHLVIIAVEE